MKYREEFEVDRGIRFYRYKVSVLLAACAFGRRLTDNQLVDYIRIANTYLDDVAGRPKTAAAIAPALTRESFPEIHDEPFYKYISDQTRKYVEIGSLQIGSAQYYRDTENENIRDGREGASSFHLAHEDNQLHISLTSGFNCGIFCGTAKPNFHTNGLMSSRFGERLIRIRDTKTFAALICDLIGAKRFHIYDVVYTDLKHYAAEFSTVEDWIRITDTGDLTDAALHKLNVRFFSTFYNVAFMPSLFAKPCAYAAERERRMIFEMNADLEKPTIVVKHPSLLECIELVS